MKQREIDSFRDAEACGLEMAMLLSQCRIYPCTYYAYVFSGEGEFGVHQLVKTRDALSLGFAHPAMTDYEAQRLLDHFDFISNTPIRCSNKLKVRGEDFTIREDIINSLDRVDHMVYAIARLIQEQKLYDFVVCNFMEKMKVERYQDAEKKKK